MDGMFPFKGSHAVAVLVCAIILAGCGADSATASKREAISKLNALVQKANEASKFAARWRDAGDKAPDTALQQMSKYYDAVLTDSRDINYDVLDSAYPKLGSMLRDTLIKSFSLSADAMREWIETRKAGKPLTITPEFYQNGVEAGRLEEEWTNWFNGHFDDINKAIQKPVACRAFHVIVLASNGSVSTSSSTPTQYERGRTSNSDRPRDSTRNHSQERNAVRRSRNRPGSRSLQDCA